MHILHHAVVGQLDRTLRVEHIAGGKARLGIVEQLDRFKILVGGGIANDDVNIIFRVFVVVHGTLADVLKQAVAQAVLQAEAIRYLVLGAEVQGVVQRILLL